jgi:hypothetical protein
MVNTTSFVMLILLSSSLFGQTVNITDDTPSGSPITLRVKRPSTPATRQCNLLYHRAQFFEQNGRSLHV